MKSHCHHNLMHHTILFWVRFIQRDITLILESHISRAVIITLERIVSLAPNHLHLAFRILVNNLFLSVLGLIIRYTLALSSELRSV